MRYWTYINTEILGPFEKEQLATIINRSSLICPEIPAGGETNDWKEASTYPEVAAALALPAPAPIKPGLPETESPLALTMRGSLISAPVAPEPVVPGPVVAEPAKEKPTAFSLTPINALKPAVVEPPKETPKPVVPEKTQAAPENIPARREPEPQPGQPGQKPEQMNALLVSIRENQAQILGRLSRLEAALAEIKALLSSNTLKT